MRASVNVPVEINVPTTIDPSVIFSDNGCMDAIVEACTEQARKTIDASLKKLFIGVYGTSNERQTVARLAYSEGTIRNFSYELDRSMRHSLSAFLKEYREDIIDKVTTEVADRIMRSSRNKTEITEKMLTILLNGMTEREGTDARTI